MLKIKNISKTYRTKKGVETLALKNVSLDFGDSGLIFITGKSGCGKSTLMNILGGLDTPDSGETEFDGKSSSSFTQKDYDAYRNSSVGFVFQEYNLIENYTVGANVALALELQGKPADRETVDAVLRQMELVGAHGQTFYDRHINELSGGQKQRVAIARVLIKEPKVILADEPTGALDSKTSEQLYELLKRLSKDRLILVVTHDKESAERYGDRIIELSDGEVASDRVLKETESVQPEGKEEKQFSCGKLPFKRSFFMGLSGLRHKVLRLVISIILSTVTFMGFGFSLTATTVNAEKTELQTMKDNNYSLYDICIYNYKKSNSGKELIESFTEKQYNAIIDFNGGKKPMYARYITLYNEIPTVDSDGNDTIARDSINFSWHLADYKSTEIDLGQENAYFRLCTLGTNTMAVEMNPETGMQDANLTPDDRFLNKDLCRLPQNSGEVAITDITFNAFLEYGYKGRGFGIVEINTPDDIIGKKIGQFTVVGVFSTEIDRKFFEEHKNDATVVNRDDEDGKSNSNDPVRAKYLNAQHSILTRLLVCEGFFDEVDKGDAYYYYPGRARVMLKLGDVKAVLDLLGKLNYEDEVYECNASVSTLYSDNMFSQGIVLELTVMIGWLCTGVLIVFSILLTLNFLLVNLDRRKKEFGILRALGATKWDITLICLIESLIIAFIEFVLALIGVIVVCVCLNNMARLSLFKVGFLEILGLLGATLGVAALATVLPVRKTVNKKPVDIINNK